MLRRGFRLLYSFDEKTMGEAPIGMQSAAAEMTEMVNARERRRKLREEDDANRKAAEERGTEPPLRTAEVGEGEREFYVPAGSPASAYEKLTESQLRHMLQRRVEQIHEIRDIHEQTHLSAEKAYRRQMLDYDERSMMLAGKMNAQQQGAVSWHREELRKLREEDWIKSRDQYLVFCSLFIFLLCYWHYMVKHYPYKPEFGTTRVLWSSSRVAGNPYTFGEFFSRGRDTDFEKELKRRKLQEQEQAEAKQAEIKASLPSNNQ